MIPLHTYYNSQNSKHDSSKCRQTYVEKKDSLLLVGMWNDTATVEDNGKILMKQNIILTIQFNNHVTIYPNDLKAHVTQKPAHKCL